MKIKELLVDDSLLTGVHAVSFVSRPAIETPFLFFNKEIKEKNVKMGRLKKKAEKAGIDRNEWYKYTAAPESEIISTSHKFCKLKAGNVFHVKEIRSWGNIPTSLKEEYKFNTDSNFFSNFSSDTENKNIDQQIFGCRHYLQRITNINEIPEYKRNMFQKHSKNKETFSTQIELSVSNNEKHEIEGVALRSGQFIYRNNIDDENDGYVYFSRNTIRKIKEKYGFNRSITIEHSDDITGTAILMDSWLVEDEEKNITEWKLKYKIVDNKLWKVIKNKIVVGFSIEGYFK